MVSAKTVPVRFGSGCIAVKEEYVLTNVYQTNRKTVNALFCIDSLQTPCKICLMRGNALTPLGMYSPSCIGSVISGKKGLYSRLDCVVNVVCLRGVFEVHPNGACSWVNVNLDIYVPIGVVQNKSLSVINIESRLGRETTQMLKNNILNNLGDSITSKEKFLMSRM